MCKTIKCSCPCCSFQALDSGGDYEICTICWWEDGGQDDCAANEVFGGPNHEYSLIQARHNFLDHGDMYDIGNQISAVANPTPQRVELFVYLAALKPDRNDLDIDLLPRLLRAEYEARE